MALLGYRRVSRVGDRADTLLSPELQADVIEAYAEQRGVEVEMLEAELDVSGGKVSRPILDAALDRIEAGVAEGLIVDTLDRLSRMAIFEALGVIRRVEAAGGQVIAVSENFDAGTPEGRMVRNMFLSIGEMQRERYGGKIAASKRSAVERGVWPMPIVPIGYLLGEDRRLEPDPAWAPNVVKAFELRANASAWAPVAELLDRGQSGAAKVIANRVYLGEIRLRVKGEAIVNRDAHPPIIGRRLWEEAQASEAPPARRGTKGPALLAGIVRCAGCRGALTRSAVGGWSAYRCLSRRAGGPCGARAIASVAALDALVQKVTLPHLRELQARSFERAAQTEDIEERLVEAEEEFEAFSSAMTAAGLGVDRAAKALRERAAKVDALRAELAAARQIAGSAMLERDIADIWDELGVEDRGHVLRGALGVVWVWQGSGDLGDRVKVIASGFEPPDLPRPGGQRFSVEPVAWSDDLAAGELRLAAGEDLGEG